MSRADQNRVVDLPFEDDTISHTFDLQLLEPRILLSSNQDPLSGDLRARLSEGLEQFAQWADSLSQADLFQSRLAMLGNSSLGSLAHVGDMIDLGFVERFTASLEAAGTASVDSLVEALKGLDGLVDAVIGGIHLPLDFNVDPLAVLGSWTDTALSFTFPFETALDFDVPLDLASVLSNYPIEVGSLLSKAVTTLSLPLTFGLDLTLPAADQFFINLGEFDLGIDFSLPNNPALPALPLQMGFLDAAIDLVHSQLAMVVDLPAEFLNPFGDVMNRIHLNQLLATPLDQLFSLTPLGNLTAMLPLDISPLPQAPQINLSSLDVFTDAVSVAVNTDFESLLGFCAIDSTTVLQMLDQLGMSFTSLQNADLFRQMSLLGSQSLADVLKLGEAIQNTLETAVTEQLAAGEGALRAAFDSAQSLLARFIGGDGINSALMGFQNGQLTYTLEFSDTIEADKAFSYDFSQGPLTLTAAGSLHAGLGTNMAITLGFDIPTLIATAQAASAAPAQGRLAQNAVLTVQVGDAAAVTVTIAADPNNASVDDLIEDVNLALLAAGLSQSVLAQKIVVSNGGVNEERLILKTRGPWVPGKLTIGGAGAAALGFAAGAVALSPFQLEAAQIVAGGPAAGMGRLAQDARFTVEVGGRAPVTVIVLADASNRMMADLIADINAALVTAGLDQVVEARVATVNVNGRDVERVSLRTLNLSSPPRLKITPGAGAAQLGLVATQATESSFLNRFFIENASAEATIDLEAQLPSGGSGTGGQASLGMVGSVTLSDGWATLGGEASTPQNRVPASASLHLGLPGTRYYLADFIAAVRDDVEGLVGDSLVLDAAAQTHFTVTLTSELLAALGLLQQPRWIDISKPSLASPDLPDITTQGLDDLLDVARLGRADFISALSSLGNYLQGLKGLQGPLGWTIPGTGLNLNSLLSYVDEFTAFINQLRIEGPSALNQTLGQLAARIRAILHLDPSQFVMRIDPGAAGVPAALQMAIDWTKEFNRTIPLRLDLGTLLGDALAGSGMESLTSILDVSGHANVVADGGATFRLNMGINLDTLTPFLYDDTGISGDVRVVGPGIGFNLSLGGMVGMQIVGGHLYVGGVPAGGVAAYADSDIPYAGFRLQLPQGEAGVAERFDLSGNLPQLMQASFGAQVDLVLPFQGPFLAADPANHDLSILVGVDGVGGLSGLHAEYPVFIEPGSLDLRALTDGLRVLLGQIENLLGRDVFDITLPIVGTQLNADYLTGLLADLPNWTAYDDPLNYLAWATNNIARMFGLTPEQILAAETTDVGEAVEFRLQFSDTYEFAAGSIDFDLGLPGLGLDIAADAQAQLAWGFNLAFGVDRDQGFYLITGNEGFQTDLRFGDSDDILQLNLGAEVTGLNADGTMANFLKIKAYQLPGQLITAGATFNVDLDSRGTDYRVYFNQLGGWDFDVAVDTTISADVSMQIEVYYDDNFPSLDANLVATWRPGQTPVVALEDIRLDLGEFLSDTIGPVLGYINDVMAPLRPVLAVLTTPLPFISGAMGHDVTILDLARLVASGNPRTEFISDLASLIDLSAHVPQFDSEYVHLGSYVFSGELAGASGPLDLALNDGTFQAGDPLSEGQGLGGVFSGFLGDLNDLGIHLPLLETPFRAVELLMGRDVELITYTTPELSLGVDHVWKIPVVYPWLVITISMELGVTAQATFGFDTRGLRMYGESGEAEDLMNGFYIAAGTGHSLIKFDGHVGIGFGVDAYAVSVRLEGGIGVDAWINIVDLDRDNRLHLDEMASYLPDHLLDLFDAGGKIYFDIRVVWEALFWEGSKRLVKKTLLDLSDAGRHAAVPDTQISWDSRAATSAIDLGVIPSATTGKDGWLSDRGVTWYRFNSERADGQEELTAFKVTDLARDDDMAIAVFDEKGHRLYNSAAWQNGVASTSGLSLPDGTYYLAVLTPDEIDNITILPQSNAATHTEVYYINDNDPGLDLFTSAPGSDDNDGLSATTPRRSLASIMPMVQGDESRVYVLVDSGNYNITSTAVCTTDNLAFIGTGWSELNYSGAPVFDINDAGSISISGMTFDGDGTGTAVRVRGMGAIDPNTGERVSNGQVVIQGNRFEDSRIAIDADGYQTLNVLDNVFTGGGDFGVRVGGTTSAFITSNDFSAFTGFCGVATTSRFSTVIDENILRGATNAVWGGDGSAVELAENDITGDVLLTADRGNVIRGNEIEGGVTLRASTSDWRANWPQHFYPPQDIEPTQIYPEFSQSIIANTIHGTIDIQSPASMVIEGNTADGIIIGGNNPLTNSVAVRGNTVNAGAGTAVLVTGDSWVDLTSNTLRGDTVVQIEGSRPSTLSLNDIWSNHTAVKVLGSGTAMMLENSITGSTAIYIESSAPVRIENNTLIHGWAYAVHGVGANTVASMIGNTNIQGNVVFESVGQATQQRLAAFVGNVVDGDVELLTGQYAAIEGNVVSGMLTVELSAFGGVAPISTFVGNTVNQGDMTLTVPSGQDWQLDRNTVNGGGIALVGGRRADVQNNTVSRSIVVTISDAPDNTLPASVLYNNIAPTELRLVGGPGVRASDNPNIGQLYIETTGAWLGAGETYHTIVSEHDAAHESSLGKLTVKVPGRVWIHDNLIAADGVTTVSAGPLRFEDNEVVHGAVVSTVSGLGDEPTVITRNNIYDGALLLTGGPGADIFSNRTIKSGMSIVLGDAWALPLGRTYHTLIYDNGNSGGQLGGIGVSAPAGAEIHHNTIMGAGELVVSGTSSQPHYVHDNVLNSTGDIRILAGPSATVVDNIVTGGGIRIDLAASVLPADQEWVTRVEGNETRDSMTLTLKDRAEVQDNTINNGTLWIYGSSPTPHRIIGNTISHSIEVRGGPAAVIEQNTLGQTGQIILDLEGHTLGNGDNTTYILGNTAPGGINANLAEAAIIAPLAVPGQADVPSIVGGIRLTGEASTPHQVLSNQVTGLIYINAGPGVVIEHNDATGQVIQVRLSGGVAEASRIVDNTARQIDATLLGGGMINDNTIGAGGLILDTGAAAEITGNTIAGGGMAISGSGAAGHAIESNTIAGTLLLSASASVMHTITDNTISGGQYGIDLPSSAPVTIFDNPRIEGTQYGLYVHGEAAVSVERTSDLRNDVIVGGQWGVYVSALNAEMTLRNNDIAGGVYISSQRASLVEDNDIHGGATGLYMSASAGGTARHNTIHDNAIGMEFHNASLQVYGNDISAGSTAGVVTDVTLGGGDWSDPNRVHDNAVGVQAQSGATIRFNKIEGNTIGVQAGAASQVHHNLLLNNATGVLISGVAGVSVVNNTIVTAAGDGIHVQSGASAATIRNNIVWTQDGYDLYVANDSQAGLASDYNNLFTSGAGKLVWYQKPFDDLFDWQIESLQDAHSIGYTRIAPTLDAPAFVNAPGGDYRQAASSTSVDGGSPADSAALEPAPNGGRVDIGAYGGTVLATASRSSYLRLEYPDFHADWQVDRARTIRWSQTNLTGDISVDVYTAAGTLAAHVGTYDASALSAIWSPQSSGLPADLNAGYRVRITSVATPSVFDESRETFTIVPAGGTFYVNDAFTAGDQYASTVGDNRNSGLSAAAPKASLLAFLRMYDLGSGDVIYVDTGSYVHVANLLIGGPGSAGDDEGLHIIGPDLQGSHAIINRSVNYAGTYSLDIDSADGVTIENLTLLGGQRGVWLHATSSRFIGRSLEISGTAAEGVRVESGSATVELTGLSVAYAGAAGIYSAAPDTTILDSVIHNNAGMGINLPTAGAASLLGNEVYANASGISVVMSVSGATAVVGSLGHGNSVHDNTGSGIVAEGSARVEGNAVSGHGGTGISLTRALTLGEPSANYNAVYNNADGIIAYTRGTLTGNLVYNNAGVGIKARETEAISRNVIHGNDIGVDLWAYYAGSVDHNVLYGNAVAGIRATGASTGAISFTHNTIDQATGDGIRLLGGVDDVTLLNNIIVVGSGYGVNVSSDSQDDFASDYNLFYTTGTGKVGYWAGAQTTLAQWRSASGKDPMSLWADPLFVNAAGGDYHEQSTRGSFHDGTLAVLLDGSGLPYAYGGDLQADAAQSRAIDRGSAASAFNLEPAPNGGFVNLGAYGNTPQASQSEDAYVMVLSPKAGDIAFLGRSSTIRWRSQDFTGTVDIELLSKGVVERTLAIGVANTGSFSWSVPADLPATAGYAIRITRAAAVGVSDTFELQTFSGIYYVNDSTAAEGDWTRAAGSLANSGLSADSPKSSIQAVFDSYELQAGDAIYVDAGTYALNSNLFLTAAQSGIRIVGYHDASHSDRHAVLNRGNTAAGSYGIEFSGASNTSLEHLWITGAYTGIYAADGVVGSGIRIENGRFYGNTDWGIWLGTGIAGPVVTGNEFSGLSSGGIAQDGGVHTGGAAASVAGNTVHDLNERYRNGIEMIGVDSVAENNILLDNYNGIEVQGARSIARGNQVSGGISGIYVGNGSAQADWVEVSGNIVHGQSVVGIQTYSSARIIGNTVYGIHHVEVEGAAVGAIVANGLIIGNVVYDNTWGIRSGNYTGLTVRGNLVYGNVIGIRTTSGLIEQNVVRDNVTGIRAYGYYSTQVLNNVISGNASVGLLLQGATSSYDAFQIANNTIYQPAGDGIRMEALANHVTLVNNIVQVAGGYGLYVSNDSQLAFASDYNLIFATGTGKAGYYGGDRLTLAQWRAASLQDANSLAVNPLFVNASAGDFHLQSLTGSFHNGSLAAMLDVSTGLPAAASGDWTLDAQQSPAIDRGDASKAYSNEPSPNGGFVNIGAYGNTAQASKSPLAYVTVLAPSAGESWMTNRSSTIRWRSQDTTGTVDVELLSGGAFVRTIATGVANTGSLAWTLPRELAQGDSYTIRITRTDSTVGLSDVFSIVPAAAVYYVNDSAVGGDGFDWTTAAGSDAADGLTRATPRATIASVLSSYQLGAGDIIYVDAGAYTLSSNIVLAAAQSGIRIVGYNDPAHTDRYALLNRNNTSSTSYAIQLTGADDVSLEYLRIAGAYRGVYAADSAGSVNLTVLGCWFFGNSDYGVYLGTGNTDANVLNSTLHGQVYAGIRQPKGLYIASDRAEVRGNDAHDMYGGGSYYAMYVTGADSVIADNHVQNNSNYYGILYNGQRGSVTGNEVIGSQIGIYSSSGANDRVNWTTVSGNTVHGQSYKGMEVGAAFVTGNTAYSVHHAGGSAMYLGWYADVVDNVVYDSTTGIQGSGSSGLVIRGNRVYFCDTGILTSSGLIEANRVYSNLVGIRSGGYYSSRIVNNLIYANTTAALVMDNVGIGQSQIVNNTIYQQAGDAIRLQNASTNVSLRNNIIYVGSGYGVSVSDDSQVGFDSDYNLFYTTGTGKVGLWQGQTFATVEEWFYKLASDFHSGQGDPLFVDPNGVDNVLGYTGGVDGGLDDNFSLAAASPAVGKGDPFLAAPAQALGGVNRATLGHQGGTAAAQVGSAAQGVSLLTLNGLEKVTQGDTVKVQWQSWGLSSYRALVQSNAGGAPNGYWSDVYRTGGDAYMNTATVSTVGVSNPAPADVYASYVGNYWSNLSYSIPTPDGTFTIRLHFADPTNAAAGSRKFDIVLQGQTAQSNFDIAAAAGGKNIATVREFQVTASGGSGIHLSFVNRTSYAIISGIEVLAAEPLGAASPTVNLEGSTDDGQTWAPIASNLAMDRLGRGEYLWNVQSPVSSNAKLRIVSAATGVSDASDRAFQVVAAGNDYYINDAAVLPGDWTTAPGNDLNSGKSADAPMASLQGLLALYTPSAGDRIFVDTGAYAILRNLTLDSRFSGVTILGYSDAGHADRHAIFNRGATTAGLYAFKLAGADDVTMRDVSITGADTGIYGADSAGSERFTLTASRLYGNNVRGLYIGTGNAGVTIDGVETDGSAYSGVNQDHGLYIGSGSTIVRNSRFHDHYAYGLQFDGGSSGEVSFNESWNNEFGLYILAGSTVQTLVHNNVIHDTTNYGIYASGWTLVQSNTVYNNAGGVNRPAIYTSSSTVEVVANEVYGSGTGIAGYGFAVRDNIVHHTTTAIKTTDNAVYEGNRLYANTTGINMAGGTVRRNTIYSNGTGINSANTYGGRIENNLIYANNDLGLQLTAGSSSSYALDVVSNTVYQPVGDAIRIDTNARYIHLYNNILQVDNGYCIRVTPGTTTGYAADYNLFYLPYVSGNAGRWSSTVAASLGEWQAASGQDLRSATGNPLFVDPSGADNVMGYAAPMGGSLMDGGRDDNFNLSAGSTAIDRGHSWKLPAADITGQTRLDDPGTVNAGSGDYTAASLGSSQFAMVGTAQNWKSDDTYWTLTFTGGFTFSFYDAVYTSCRVSTNGFIYFGNDYYQSFDKTNTQAELIARPMIAPLWADLKTNGAGDDIYVDSSVAGQVTIRWNATVVANGNDANFSATLFTDGRVQFDYGLGNASLPAPTAGISDGTGYHYLLLPYDGQSNLTAAASIRTATQAGIVDIGAYEFRGSTLDVAAPTISGSTPSVVAASGQTGQRMSQITLGLSEAVDEIDALASGNYELRKAGGDTFGSGDTLISLLPQYTTGGMSIVLNLTQGAIPAGLYRLTVRGGAGAALHDLSGRALDGNSDGQAGGDWVREFRVLGAGVIVTPTAGLVVTESGGTASFSVSLQSQPSTTVTVPITSSNAAEGTVSTNLLTFTAANWNQPQTVTVTGANDIVRDGNKSFTVSVGPAASSDADYQGLAAASVALTNLDDEADDVLAPSVTASGVNNGAAGRSMVNEITISFSEDVSGSLGVEDIEILNLDTGLAIDRSAIALTYDPVSSLARLTFATLLGGSLPDGNYYVTVTGSGVTDAAGNWLDGNANGAAGGDYHFAFHRYFGDTDGNRAVDSLEMLRMRAAYLRSSADPKYNAAFDADNDGDVDAVDMLRLRANYLKVLSPLAPPSQQEAAEQPPRASAPEVVADTQPPTTGDPVTPAAPEPAPEPTPATTDAPTPAADQPQPEVPANEPAPTTGDPVTPGAPEPAPEPAPATTDAPTPAADQPQPEVPANELAPTTGDPVTPGAPEPAPATTDAPTPAADQPQPEVLTGALDPVDTPAHDEITEPMPPAPLLEESAAASIVADAPADAALVMTPVDAVVAPAALVAPSPTASTGSLPSSVTGDLTVDLMGLPLAPLSRTIAPVRPNTLPTLDSLAVIAGESLPRPNTPLLQQVACVWADSPAADESVSMNVMTVLQQSCGLARRHEADVAARFDGSASLRTLTDEAAWSLAAEALTLLNEWAEPRA